MDQHINVDAVSRLLSPPLRRGARTVTALAAATVCLLLMDATRAFVVDEAGARTTGVLDVPTWCLVAVMPLALWGMAARFLRHAYTALRSDPEAARDAAAPGAAGPALRGTPMAGGDAAENSA
jgi:TRAP-type C4-dicarboxylate transport system permease small subunit